MRLVYKCLIFCCLFYFGCEAKEEDVLEFGDGDFDTRIAEHETALVMFYAPWCGHCKRLKPEYAKAAEDLIRNDPPVALVKIDCTEAGKETCNKNSVSGYPTLKIYRNGEFSQEYNGPRDASGIVKYMRAQVGPSSKEVKSVAELEKFLTAEKEASVVGFFEKESDLKAAFLKIADKLREKVRFAHSTFKQVLDKQGVNDGIVLFRPSHLNNKFEESTIQFSGKADGDSIKTFISNNIHGLVGHRKSDNRQEFENPLIVAYFNVDYVKNPKGTNYWRNRILKVAKEFEGKAKFAVSSKDDFQQELNEFGLEFVKGDRPVVTGRDSTNRKFVLKEDFSVESLATFAADVLEGRLEPYLKSEALPENNDLAPVKVAVARNFDELVVDSDKDVLIEFYAPWCGHCKKLAPVFDELGEQLKHESGVVVAKMDATANDVPAPFDVRGFPTIYWVPRGAKGQPVRYEGGRELADFLAYVAKHASTELHGFDRKGKPKADKTEL